MQKSQEVLDFLFPQMEEKKPLRPISAAMLKKLKRCTKNMKRSSQNIAPVNTKRIKCQGESVSVNDEFVNMSYSTRRFICASERGT